MNNAAKGSKSTKQEVLTMCWQYLRENFHKFSDPNKIKVALALSTKTIPTEVQGEIKVTEMPMITKTLPSGENRLLEFNIGSS